MNIKKKKSRFWIIVDSTIECERKLLAWLIKNENKSKIKKNLDNKE